MGKRNIILETFIHGDILIPGDKDGFVGHFVLVSHLPRLIENILTKDFGRDRHASIQNGVKIYVPSSVGRNDVFAFIAIFDF
jgi:hypothetical protein